jgi:hypothetical protein
MTKKKPTTDFIAHFARYGYVAKGFTYVLLAFLAFRAAAGDGHAQNQRRAMGVLDRVVVGQAVLAAVAVGLGGYALWRFHRAWINPEADGWTKRIGSVFISLVNAALAWQAGLLAFTSDEVDAGDQAIHWSAVIMRYPLGIWAVGIGGVCITAYGVRQIYRGIVCRLDTHLRLHTMDAAPRRSAVLASQFGIAARGVVFIMIGYFLVIAALRADPTEARDFGDSLQQLRSQPYGHLLLFAMAFGLFAYAVYQFVRARYRHIPTE